jgi:hypothetical protein
MKNKTTVSERTRIARALMCSDLLRGLDRNQSKPRALWAIHEALTKCGFVLDMVSADIIMGDKGQRCLSFSRQDDLIDGDGVRIENAAICFVWENLAATVESPRWEFLAYVS